MLEFVLRYKGPLRSKCDSALKHRIRQHLHPQLEQLGAAEDFFHGATPVELPQATMLGRRAVLPEGVPSGYVKFFRVRMAGYDVIPFVTRYRRLVCEIKLTWIRREAAGGLIQHGGDIDNRLKCLFDALRMPHDEDEIAGRSSSAGEHFYCLLEDDELITKVAVETFKSLEPPDTDDPRGTNVDLLVHVTLRSTSSVLRDLFDFPA